MPTNDRLFDVTSDYRILNQSVFNGYNEIEQSFFIAYRDSMLVSVLNDTITLNDDILEMVEKSAMKFVEKMEPMINYFFATLTDD